MTEQQKVLVLSSFNYFNVSNHTSALIMILVSLPRLYQVQLMFIADWCQLVNVNFSQLMFVNVSFQEIIDVKDRHQKKNTLLSLRCSVWKNCGVFRLIATLDLADGIANFEATSEETGRFDRIQEQKQDIKNLRPLKFSPCCLRNIHERLQNENNRLIIAKTLCSMQQSISLLENWCA